MGLCKGTVFLPPASTTPSASAAAEAAEAAAPRAEAAEAAPGPEATPAKAITAHMEYLLFIAIYIYIHVNIKVFGLLDLDKINSKNNGKS